MSARIDVRYFSSCFFSVGKITFHLPARPDPSEKLPLICRPDPLEKSPLICRPGPLEKSPLIWVSFLLRARPWPVQTSSVYCPNRHVQRYTKVSQCITTYEGKFFSFNVVIVHKIRRNLCIYVTQKLVEYFV